MKSTKLPGAGVVDAWAQSLPAGLVQPQTAIGSMTPPGSCPSSLRTLDVASVDTVQELNPIAWPMTAPTCLSTMTWTATVLAGIAAPELFTAPRLARLPSANSPVHVHPSAATQPFAISDLLTAAKTLL